MRSDQQGSGLALVECILVYYILISMFVYKDTSYYLYPSNNSQQVLESLWLSQLNICIVVVEMYQLCQNFLIVVYFFYPITLYYFFNFTSMYASCKQFFTTFSKIFAKIGIYSKWSLRLPVLLIRFVYLTCILVVLKFSEVYVSYCYLFSMYIFFCSMYSFVFGYYRTNVLGLFLMHNNVILVQITSRFAYIHTYMVYLKTVQEFALLDIGI
eukprot:TRINITY_DN8101_c0_g1_i13.p2 TRINITY_DN8101_c0_g1~~TRINITY_DN8101_c0_g1_i13.p2  ORF type:complete len:212 (-),score=-6.40 TRINITY_DN8101_c0_g1_i13:89-724(-)